MIQNVERLLFTRELAVLLKSGVSLREALSSLYEQSQFSAMRKIITAIIGDVENGQMLAHALKRHPKVFSHLYINLIVIGEQSGTLSKNLEFLALQLEKSYQLRKKIESILLYPTIVFLTAVTLASLISVFILPKLVKLFDSFETGLPLSTQALLWFAALMKAHGIAIFISGIAILIGIRIATLLPIIRPHWHRLLLRLPLLGGFLRSVYLAQFFRDMGVMLSSGLPLSQALFVEERSMMNLAFSDMARNIHRAVLEGKSVSEELSAQYSFLVPSVVVKMIAAGEQSGKLSDTFLYLSNFLDDEVDRSAKNFTVVLEPVLLIVIASVVVFIALAILSPIYSLTGAVRR